MEKVPKQWANKGWNTNLILAYWSFLFPNLRAASTAAPGPDLQLWTENTVNFRKLQFKNNNFVVSVLIFVFEYSTALIALYQTAMYLLQWLTDFHDPAS